MPSVSVERDNRRWTLPTRFAYAVANFQRDFSWTETQIDELWNDITNTINENRQEHFMGAMVVNNSNKPKLRLIDGQQRMTTISLLMCVVRDVAIEKGDQELSIYISEKYLGSRNIYRLGNMTLLDSSVNSKLGNRSFQEKSEAFAHSKLEITKEVADYSVWSPKQIEQRQEKMSKAACQIWRLDY